MKKNRILIIILFVILAVGAVVLFLQNSLKLGDEVKYATNDYPNLNMTIIDGTATATDVTVRISNDTGVEVSGPGDDKMGFSVQVERGRKWYEIKYKESAGTAQYVGWKIENGETIEWNLSWTNRYGGLPKGHYRIVRQVELEGEEPHEIKLSAEFNVK